VRTWWTGGARRNSRWLRALLVLTLALLAGRALVSGVPAARVLAEPAATPTPIPAATVVPLDSASDPFGTGQAIPPYQQGPDAWMWHAALPGARIVLDYGVLGCDICGVVGLYGSDEAGLLDHLTGLAHSYVVADPTHPVIAGLDIVDPLADALPQAEGFYVDRMDPATIEHYVQFTRQHHLLLFLDMQIERSTVQRELAYVWPYLQLPWVHLAFDPEWDESHDGQSEGCGLNFDPNHTGRSYASEINYMTDQLSALVQAQHLPPKIFILHQYQFAENPAYDGYCGNAKAAEGWQNLHLNPGVQIVVNDDGVGAAAYGGNAAKIEDYQAFDANQRIQYPGLKMYYYHPGIQPLNYDTVLMTPAQVIALDPTPLLIMYA
jgi:hypothetical protein